MLESGRIKIVTALAAKGKGLTRQEIIGLTKLPDNGKFSLDPFTPRWACRVCRQKCSRGSRKRKRRPPKPVARR